MRQSRYTVELPRRRPISWIATLVVARGDLDEDENVRWPAYPKPDHEAEACCHAEPKDPYRPHDRCTINDTIRVCVDMVVA